MSNERDPKVLAKQIAEVTEQIRTARVDEIATLLVQLGYIADDVAQIQAIGQRPIHGEVLAEAWSILRKPCAPEDVERARALLVLTEKMR
jgi:hypothetical protein